MSRARGMGCTSIALALLVAGLPVHAEGDAAGTNAGSFLTVGAGASVLSMAGATLAGGRDLAAAAWNPASLSRIEALEFSLSHAPLPGGASQDWLAAGGRVRGGLTRWGVNALFHQEGSIEGRDASNNPTSSLSVSDLAVGARVARPFGSKVSAGLGGQWVHESLAGTNGSGFAFDAGLRGQSGPVGFALAARNVGGGMEYGGTRYDLPGVVAAGVSWSDEVRGLHVNADFESPSHYYRDLRFGGEWNWKERVALRAGYRYEMDAPSTEQLSGATFGFGAGVGGIWLDYGFSPNGDEGAGQHRIGITFRPGQMGSGGSEPESHKLTPTPEPVHAPKQAPMPAPVKVPKATREPSHAVTHAPEPSPAATKPSASPTPAPASSNATTTTPAATPAASTPTSAPASAAAPAPAAVAPPPIAPPPPVVVEKPQGDSGVAPPPASATRPKTVVVVEGETLGTIARRWKTTVAAIMMENNLVSEQVRPGTRLKLPPESPR